MPSYAVPALDKGLDILELLSAQNDGLSQAQIAQSVGRTVGEIFRVLQTLERRGFVVREPLSGLYTVSLMMFELAHRNPPLRGLVQAALTPMRRLSTATGQTCNLSVLSGGHALVVAQVESPSPFGFQVRIGAEFPVEDTATGVVLIAFADEVTREIVLTELDTAAPDSARRLRADVEEASAAGYVRQVGRLLVGIVDIVFPIRGTRGFPSAALTVPVVATADGGVDVERIQTLAGSVAAEISRLIHPEHG